MYISNYRFMKSMFLNPSHLNSLGFLEIIMGKFQGDSRTRRPNHSFRYLSEINRSQTSNVYEIQIHHVESHVTK